MGRRIITPYRDKKGKLIGLADTVQIEGKCFTVEINPFNNKIVIDGDSGTERLRNIHKQVEIIEKGDVKYEDNN